MRVMKTQRIASIASIVVGLVTGCSAGEGGDTGFGPFGPGGGDAVSGPADDPAAMDSGTGEGVAASTSDDGEDTQGVGSDGALGSSSGDGDGAATTMPMDDGIQSTGNDDGMPMTDEGGGSSDDGGGNPGAQPLNGMWAHCVEDDFTNCGAADTCIFLDAAEGFCSVQNCTNAAVDCDPAPAGTSVTPICADAVSTSVCALDCSVASCPTGMACTTVSINMGPDYEVCV